MYIYIFVFCFSDVQNLLGEAIHVNSSKYVMFSALLARIISCGPPTGSATEGVRVLQEFRKHLGIGSFYFLFMWIPMIFPKG